MTVVILLESFLSNRARFFATNPCFAINLWLQFHWLPPQVLHNQRAMTYTHQFDSWDPWFALPYAFWKHVMHVCVLSCFLSRRYLQDPKNDPAFRLYFTPKWQAHLQLSLTNFLSLIFRATPLPKVRVFRAVIFDPMLTPTPSQKVLLLEKWHRSRTQKILRSDLNDQLQRIGALRTQLDRSNDKVD